MLRELFADNRNIIINTDIDGILSGILLVKYLNCRIVGFTNSRDTVWLEDAYDDLYRNIYIDMFVTDSRAICVDQHIVAVNSSHQSDIIASGTKFSPQIDGNKIFTDNDFKNKYPFGTVQYIIAQLESEGIHVTLPPLNGIVPNSNITFGDLIQRADDAMKTTLVTYIPNARNWWNWLLQKSNNAQSIQYLINYLGQLKQNVINDVNSDGHPHRQKEYDDRLKDKVELIKSNTKDYFNRNFSCRTSDGGFNSIVDTSGNVYSYFDNYVRTIGALLGCPAISIPTHYNAHIGVYCRTRWLPIFESDFLRNYSICGHRIFSYAFIYGPSNDSNTNFSFTIDMR